MLGMVDVDVRYDIELGWVVVCIGEFDCSSLGLC